MNNIIKRVWNQNRMVNIEDLRGMAFQAESGGHTFEISGINDAGESIPLSGTVAGVFMRPDNADIAIVGSASNGVVSVTLPADCYAVNGRFVLTIFVTSDSQKVAVYAAVGTVARTSGGAVAGDTPQDVVDLINAINTAIAGIPADYTQIMDAIADIKKDATERVYGKNLFNKNDYAFVQAGINSSTNKLAGNNALRTVYVPVKPNTPYTVSKMKSARFLIGFTDAETVANGIDCTGVVYNNNATYLSSASGPASKYILVTCYVTSETPTLDSILATLQIEEGTVATAYTEYQDPYITAKDKAARDGVASVSDNIDDLRDKYVDELVNFSNRFDLLADAYLDDFYTRESFIDTAHPYTKYGADVAPTTVTGAGASIANSAAEVVYARDFSHFPVYITIGHMAGVKSGIALYAREAPVLVCEAITFNVDGLVRYKNASIGYIDELTDWLFIKVLPDKVIIYDDSGNRVDVNASYVHGLPKNYGLYFGGDNATYGYTSLIEWAYKPLDNMDVNRAILMKNTLHPNHYMTTMIYSRSYDNNGTPTTETATADYVKVLDASDNDDAIKYTNNPILRFALDYAADKTYRSEAGFRTDLITDGKLLRHRFSADFMIPQADNLENPVSHSFATDIIQVHDNNFSAAGWSDPPPVVVYYQNGKLYATVRYIETGEVPSSASVITSRTYYLCDVPYDDWFTLEYEVRVSYLSGLAPYLVISINGSEKLRCYSPVGYNIIQNGGNTRVTFGLYAPGLRYPGAQGSYDHEARKMYVANVKYEY